MDWIKLGRNVKYARARKGQLNHYTNIVVIMSEGFGNIHILLEVQLFLDMGLFK